MKNVLSLESRPSTIHHTARDAKLGLLRILHDKHAVSAVDIIIGIVIAVVAGGALLALLNTAVPDLFSSIVSKISSMLGS